MYTKFWEENMDHLQDKPYLELGHFEREKPHLKILLVL